MVANAERLEALEDEANGETTLGAAREILAGVVNNLTTRLRPPFQD